MTGVGWRLAAWAVRTLAYAAALFLGTEEGVRRGIVQINASHRDPPVL